MSVAASFQQVFAIVRAAKNKVDNLLDLADKALWRNLEYGKPEEIVELAKNYEILRQKYDLIDNALRYCQDINPNLNLLFSGKASQGLVKKYYKLAATAKIIESSEFNAFFRAHPPEKAFQFNVSPLENEQIPAYIRKYMRENRVTEEIQEKVKEKFPLTAEENPFVSYPKI